jgi:hypothetical protein
MGDSPVREYYASLREEGERDKLGAQLERLKMLRSMLHGPGLGEHDYRMTLLEKQLHEHLQSAYELLELITGRYK